MISLWLEHLNGEIDGLDAYVGSIEQGKALSDDVMDLLIEKLGADSLDEFVQKLPPLLYMNMDWKEKKITFQQSRDIQKAEIIYLYEHHGFFEKLQRWIEDIKSGRRIILEDKEEQDWFLPEVERLEADFVAERKQIIHLIDRGREKEARVCLLTAIHKYDKGMYLLRRLVRNYDMTEIQEKGPYVIRNSGSQLKCMAASPCSEELSAWKRSTRQLFYKLVYQVCFEEGNEQRYPELFYWNYVIEVMTKEERKKSEWYQNKDRICEYYQTAMKQFWMMARPKVNSMLQIVQFYQHCESNQKILFMNCSPRILNTEKMRVYLQRFFETTNTKTSQKYAIQHAIIPGLSEDKPEKKAVRQIFPGTEEREALRNQTVDRALSQDWKELLEQYSITCEVKLEQEQTELDTLVSELTTVSDRMENSFAYI